MTQFNNHHIIGSGSAPTYVLGAAAQIGSGSSPAPSVAISGNDLGHTVTLVVGGTGSLAAGLLFTGTPGNVFTGSGDAASAAVTPANANAAAIGFYATMTSNLWKVYSTIPPVNGNTYIFMINTIG
jgi:hypothetical protein